MFDASSAEQLDDLISEVAPTLHTIACNPHGTRAVQKLVDCLNREGGNPDQVRARVHLVASKSTPKYHTYVRARSFSHVFMLRESL
jgi:hypothetical protein